MTDELLVQRGEGVVVATLNRPERRNALSRHLVQALGDLGESLRHDEESRVVILTGAGSDAFCAGADLKERQTMSENEVRSLLATYRTAWRWLREGTKPTVALLNGPALGGGLELALHCHLRFAVPQATLALPETSLGIIPGAGGTQLLPRLIGEARAMELILLNRRLNAEEALTWGLVHRIVGSGSESAMEESLRIVRPMVEGAPIALAAALHSVRSAQELPWSTGMELELVAYDRCLRSEDRLEALKARTEKRPPVFRGR